jgi:cytochrome c biogenesis factor
LAASSARYGKPRRFKSPTRRACIGPLPAYAFVSHDFRLRYVAAHSDRSMPTVYLITALWGGQDGSLLWWLFLLGVYIGACVKWLGRRYVELQPYIIATLDGRSSSSSAF